METLWPFFLRSQAGNILQLFRRVRHRLFNVVSLCRRVCHRFYLSSLDFEIDVFKRFIYFCDADLYDEHV